jgi:hypothetical protein
MLPDHTASYRVVHEDDPQWWTCIEYVLGEPARYEHIEIADTEAHARAKMLIYFLENKLIPHREPN